MKYGGETLLGGAGGFDGDHDDYLFRGGWALNGYASSSNAPAFPLLAGDTGDSTKISYFTPRMAGFQLGASYTPTSNQGDQFKSDTIIEDHIGVGLNFDRSFGNFRVRGSAVYASGQIDLVLGPLNTQMEDIKAWSVGAIFGWGPVSIGGGYADNGDSGRLAGAYGLPFDINTNYWNAAAALDLGRLYLAAGYFESEFTWTPADPASKYKQTSLTADYSVAPGLALYAEADWIEDSLYGESSRNEATAVILGTQVSF